MAQSWDWSGIGFGQEGMGLDKEQIGGEEDLLIGQVEDGVAAGVAKAHRLFLSSENTDAVAADSLFSISKAARFHDQLRAFH